MKDGSLIPFAKLQLKRKQNGSFLKTSKDCLPLTTESLLPELLKQWRLTVSHDGSGQLYQRATSVRPTVENDGFALLPTPVKTQGRSLTSGMAKGTGRKKGSTGQLKTTLNDLVFLDRLLNNINQQSTDGQTLSVDQLQTHIKTTGSISGLLNG